MLRKYWQLTKPGVMLGNLLTTAAGFLLAAAGNIDWKLFLATNIGTALVISSACVINNYLDQDIDAKMERTKKRPIVAGDIPPMNALLFGIILGLVGLAVLALFTHWLVVAIGVVGFIVYVWLYGAFTKRRSIHGTLVGSISGAIPILAGYVAAAGNVDSGAVVLFIVLFIWQMPEFYSIAIYRQKEYANAGVPVITVIKGIEHTKKLIVAYVFAFVLATLSLGPLGYTGYSFFIIMATLGMYWLLMSFEAFKTDSEKWARRMFRFSLIILLVFCLLISIEHILP